MKYKRFTIPIIIIFFMLILNIISWNSTAFSDFYVENIFPYIMTPFSFLTNLVPFSVGEMLIILGIILLIFGVLSFILLMIFKKGRRKKIASVYGTILLWIVTFVVSTETTNCFIMYHCTKFSDKYFTDSQHNDEQLAKLYSLLAHNTNELADKVQRDGNGLFRLSADLNSEAERAMKNIAEDYPLLKGFYPNAKPIMCDFFMSQQYLLGIYFPFSLESNYNPASCDINLPNTVCHEFSHLKGFIQEDEANFIAFIACTSSDNADFQYSGYINALEYVENEVFDAGIDLNSFDFEVEPPSPEVYADMFNFVPENYWEENESIEIIPTETVEAVSDFAADTSLKLNGVEDGIHSYCRLVNLLLDYYFPEQ